AACDELIRRVAALAQADPPLDLRSHEPTRKLLDEPSPLDNAAYKHREDLSTQPSAPGRHRSGTGTVRAMPSARSGTGRGTTGGDDHRTSAARAAHRLTTADAPHSEP